MFTDANPASRHITYGVHQHHFSLYLQHVNMPPTSSFSHFDKLRIVNFYKQGCSVNGILKQFRDTHSFATTRKIRHVIDSYRIGRFREIECVDLQEPSTEFINISDEHCELIRNFLQNNPGHSSADVEKHLADIGINISRRTVQRAIESAGWTSSQPRYCQMIREANKVKRTDFCRGLILANENFEDVIFTDESTIQLQDNKSICYRPKDGSAPNFPRAKHPLKIHMWAGISRKGKTPLLLFEGIMEKTFYTNVILRQVLKPYIHEEFPSGHRFVQDNDPKHTSKYAKDYMEKNNINWWKWPAESCDLNPIEMVWNMVKRNVAKRGPKTKDQLMQYIQEFWDQEMTVEVCNTFIDHIYKVVPIVSAINGRPSCDLPKKLFPEKSRGKSMEYFDLKLQERREQLDMYTQ